MVRANLVLITGPAAVGKSTTARALQAHLATEGRLWLLTELDVFGRGLPREWIAWGGRRGRLADLGFSYDQTDDGIALTLGTDGRRVMAAFHRSIAAIARSGLCVICETIVHDAEDWADWNEALAGLTPVWVRLGAPVPTLEAREQLRRPEGQGLGRGMSARPLIGVYDVEADTGSDRPEQIAAEIASQMI